MLLCRDEARGREALGELERETRSRTLEVVRLDVSDLADVRRVAGLFRDGRVDALVHNAGVLPDRRVTTRDGLELTLATNLVGPFLLTSLLMPALERARALYLWDEVTTAYEGLLSGTSPDYHRAVRGC